MTAFQRCLYLNPLYPINMLFCTAKGILKGVATDCRMGRFSWTVLTGCEPKSRYKYKEKKEMPLFSQR